MKGTMESVRKKLAVLDIFVQNKLLRNISVCSLLLVILYPVIDIKIIYPVMTTSIINNMKHEVERFTIDIAKSLGLRRVALEGATLPDDVLNRIKNFEKELNVTRVKIYTASGETIYSSNPADIGTVTREWSFTETVAKGYVHTNLLHSKVPPDDGETAAVYLVNTKVPIMEDNTFVGAFEVFYNITNRILFLDRLVARFSTSLFAVGLGLTCTIIFMALKMAKAEEALGVSQRELRRAKQHLERLIESSTDAIIATDKEGKVILFNKGAEDLSGYTREEAIGKGVALVSEGEEHATEVMTRMREGGGKVSALETTLRAKDSTGIPVLVSASFLYDERGQEVGTVRISKDLRERKRAEEQLIRAEKMASLGLLTAGVSHEILNPLNIIILRLHTMINDPSTPAEVTKYLRVLETHANRIAKITRDLLSFARQRPPERRLLDLNESVRRTLALVEHTLQLQDIAVRLRLSDQLPSILADQDQLQQVLLNLLTNAKDAMPDGGQLTLSTEKIQDDGAQFVELRVEDTGEGIAPEHIEKLFDPFFTTKAEGTGTGLGLAICQGIVATHGGTIWAENMSDGGVAFIVRLAVEGGNDEQGLSG
ncbi:MAG: nitrogen regulation protein NR(II) [Candidatus Tectimicrobiota bacterium]